MCYSGRCTHERYDGECSLSNCQPCLRDPEPAKENDTSEEEETEAVDFSYTQE